MMVNQSETWATTRLIQCASLGIKLNDITHKFYIDPERDFDLDREHFTARQSVIDNASVWARQGRREDVSVH
ncbi:hypothetical protein BDV98DRAFT_568034 [Pterulicium gracile]|uniref:Uncharacterized protein n=1 Tax=Pterulicium gracile TaxID=1884261 RepID=A0A5C3QHB0_9AGAR|nr:hypothetical protein BDV98DRAFT_568034 [Pterula gracilis]